MDKIGEVPSDGLALVKALAQTTEKLEALLSQANAQFKAGNKHATFNKQTIDICSSIDE